MSNLWPNLNNVSISLDGAAFDILSNEELGILYRLVSFIAAQSVYTYSDPSDDPHVSESRAHLVARCTLKEWVNARSQIAVFFTVSEDGKWRLKDHGCIRLSRDAQRSAIPTNVRSSVLNRDGKRCVYCGGEDGPFHFDHLWPVSRGGLDTASNIVLACSPCNLSKGDKTLLEWVSKR